MEEMPGFPSAALLKALLTGILDAVTVIDRQFRIVWANDARARMDHELRRISGKKERMNVPRYTLQDMAGRFCYERFRRRASPCPQCPSLEAFRTGRAQVTERRIDLPKGGVRWGETRAYPIFGNNGEVEYVMKISREITDRMRNQNERDDYIRSLETALSRLSGEAAIPAGTDSPLTAREKEVLILVARGLSNPEVAEVLKISPHTVKRHVVNIFQKLDLNDRTQAALWAAKHRMV